MDSDLPGVCKLLETCPVEIKRGQVLRRIIVKIYGFNKPDMTFQQLESTIRTQFKLPVSSKFAIVYTDKENDEVTMANDDDIVDVCTIQKLNPVRLTALPQEEEESRSSAHDARPPEPLTVDPPPWAADILLKLDQLLLAANKPLVEPHVASGSPASTKIEDHFVVVGDSPIDDSTLKKMEERFLVVGESSIAGPTIEPAKDAVPSKERKFDNAQSKSDFELLKRAMILRQRLMTEEVSEVVGRGSESTVEGMV